MLFRAEDDRVGKDVRVWFLNAAQDKQAAELLYKNGLYLPCLRTCQGMLEKVLKGYAVAQGRWENVKNCKHSLRSAAQLSGVLDSLPEELASRLGEISHMHELGNYPYDDVEYKQLMNQSYVKDVLEASCRIYEIVKKEIVEYGRQGGENGSDHAASK